MAAEELVERVLRRRRRPRARARRRPARPHICRRLATVPGKVTQIAASSSPMSMPSSSASVATTASSSPLDQAPPRSRGAAGACSRRGRARSASARSGLPALGQLLAREAAGSARSRGGSCRKQIVRTSWADQVGEQVGRLGERRAAGPGRLVDQRRVPHRDLAAGPRGAVVVDQLERRCRSAARPARPGWRSSPRRARSAARPRRPAPAAAAAAARWRRGSRRRRGRCGPRRPRPSRGWRGSRPSAVVGQDPDVEHVRVGQDEVARGAGSPGRSSRGVSPS